MTKIGALLGLFGSIYMFQDSFVRDNIFVNSMNTHLVEFRPQTYAQLAKKKVDAMIRYRFSHAGLSDLYDHVK